MAKQKNKSLFKSREDVVSMFLGLVVVAAVVGFMVNFIEKRKGNIDIPGVSNDLKIAEIKRIAEEQEKFDSVVVEKNDSLWKIAVRVYSDGYKWTEIVKANSIKNPDLIYSGQKLQLPKIEKIEGETKIEEKTVVTQKTDYKVVRGDSLWKIAVRVYGDGYRWTKIWNLNRNKINDPNRLEIGMMIKLE